MAGSKNLIGKHEKMASKMLRRVTSIFEKADIHYILDYGTLLGLIREHRLLPWDTDIDLSISSNDLHKLLKIRWKLWLLGYRTRVYKFSKDVSGFKKGAVRIVKVQTHILFFKQHDVLDVFIKKKINNEYVDIVGKKPAVFRGVPAKYIENTTKITFKEKDYTIPLMNKEYLAFLYGDWETPVKTWNYKTDDNCVKKEVGNI